jgi:PAS domain S-box-containing protein
LTAILERTSVQHVLAEPLLYRDDLLGCIVVDSEAHPFGEADQGTLRLLASQAAIAIQNARLHADALRRGDQLTVLHEVAQSLARLRDPQQVAAAVLPALQRLMPGTGGQFWRLEPDTDSLGLVAGEGLPAPGAGTLRLPVGQGLAGAAVAARRLLVSADVSRDARFANHGWAARQPLAAGIALPLLYDDRVLGAIVILSHTPRVFTAGEERLLSTFAAHAALAMQNAQLDREAKDTEMALRQHAEQLEVLRNLSAEVSHELALDRLLHLLLARAAALVGADSGAVYLWQPEQDLVVPAAWHGLGEWQADIRYRLGQGIAGSVAQSRQGIIVNDYRSSGYAHPVTLERTKITAAMGEPLLYRDELVGAITLNHESGRRFTEKDQALVRLFADQAAVAIQNARLYEAVRCELSDRMRAESLLRDKSDELDRFFTLTLDLLCIADTNGHFHRVNPAWSELLGHPRSELEGTRFLAYVHPEDLPAMRAALGTQAARGEVIRFVNRCRCRDGSYRWIEWHAAAYQSTLIYAAARDITGRKHAEDREAQFREQLRALSTRLQMSQEVERSRIAREMHDHLGQLLTALKLDLGQIERHATALGGQGRHAVSLVRKVNSAKALADDLIGSVHRLAFELRPGALDRLGLEAAIDEEVRAFQARTGLPCEWKAPAAVRTLLPDQATAVFRILQEALTNVSRHARATRVRVRLRYEPWELVLVVQDDGVGLQEQALRKPPALGLLGMR